MGRGRHLGLHKPDGGPVPPQPGPGQRRGRTSPAIEGPYRPQEFQLYFYATDHLGSSTVVTDAFAEPYEHLRYFPSGEPWVDQGGTATLLPYQFTAKELDAETGLYYFGARYYEPRLQRWLSADPAFDRYLDGEPNGGVHAPMNLALYTYAGHNPVKYTDPDGQALLLGAIISAGMDASSHGRSSSSPTAGL